MAVPKILFVLAAFLSAALGPFARAGSDASNSVRAQLSARSSAVISAEIAGKIRQLHVLEGDSFQQGDLLISLDDTVQQAQVERARAVLSAAERTNGANRRLHALNSVGQIELDGSEAEVAKAKAELSYATAMLAKCQLRAPFTGRMAEQRIHEQEFVQAGQPLFEIVDGRVPQVDFIAPSRWLAWLVVGHPIQVSIDETGGTYSGTIERISAKVDPVSQSIRVVAGIAGSHRELMPGMSGSVSVSPPPQP